MRTVTILFAEIVGSTRLWEEHPSEMRTAVERYDEILRSATEDRSGEVIASAGSAFVAAFELAQDAVEAAIQSQRFLESEGWAQPAPVRVRIGLRTGEMQERGGVLVGPVPDRAAQLAAAGHGGQVLVAARTASMLDDVDLIDLGEHRLDDMSAVERVFEVGADGEPSGYPELRTLDARRGNLPAPATNLVGRERLLPEIVDVARAHRLVTLTGVGGVGKTRLGLEVGAELAGDFRDGVWLVELAPVDAVSVPGAIATAMGITPEAGVPVTQAVANALQSRRVLIVLDNCEHVVDAAARAVETILAQSASVSVLATSRESLRVAGEQARLVPPLDLEGGAESA